MREIQQNRYRRISQQEQERINRIKRKKRIMKKRKRRRRIATIILILLILLLFVCVKALFRELREEKEPMEVISFQDYIETIDNIFEYKNPVEKPVWSEEFLPINEYSRPGDAMEKVDAIVIHYTANPDTTAEQNRNYFAGLAESGENSVSSHFVIGMDGEIIQCIPCDEISYASNDRNYDTISIECCIPDETGEFTEATYDSLIKLSAWLMGEYRLKKKDILRHYDITGKLCPKYYVEHEDLWEQMKTDIMQEYLDN